MPENPDLLTMMNTGPQPSATSDMPVLAAPEPDAPVVEATEPPAVTEPGGDTPPVAPVTEPVTEKPVETAPEPKPRPPNVESYTQATEQRRAAEARADKLADSLEQALGAIKTLTESVARPEPEEPVDTGADDPRPTADKYEEPHAYDTALVEWSARQATRVALATVEQQRVAAETKAAADKVEQERRDSEAARQKANEDYFAGLQQSYNDRRTKALERLPDFVEVAEAESVKISVPMAHAIMQHENGPEIAYWLGRNPDEAARIHGLTTGQSFPPGHPMAGQPVPDVQRQLFALGAIVDKAVAATKPQVSKAPPPATPVGSRSAATEPSADEMTGDQYYEQHKSTRARREAQRRAGIVTH